MEENKKITVEITEGEKLILDFAKKLMAKLGSKNEKEFLVSMMSWITSVADSLDKVGAIIEKANAKIAEASDKVKAEETEKDNAEDKGDTNGAKYVQMSLFDDDGQPNPDKVETEDFPDFLQ